MHAYEATEELIRMETGAMNLHPRNDEERRAIEVFVRELGDTHTGVQPYFDEAESTLAGCRLLLSNFQRPRDRSEWYRIIGDTTIQMGLSHMVLRSNVEITIPSGFFYKDSAVFLLTDGLQIVINEEHFPLDGIPVERLKK